MMEYQVTARKWRPQDFSQVIGQEHVTTALSNAITSNKIPHAYLFSGPRGVGKTSTARILSKILNCVKSPEVCGVCPACVEISSGQSLDVREIDGASNRGIEQIREIRDNAVYAPLALKYKIFIIDEVHMLTKEASNALLKVLEEPPKHVIFMLATTEANKVLPTIRSRCQHYLLKRIPIDTLVGQLSLILDTEGYTYEKSALEEIAQAGDGSMRDSQTILDQVILYSNGNLTLQSTREVLGIPSSSYYETILRAIYDQDIVLILEQIHQYLMELGDGMLFVENWIVFLRKAMLVKKLPAKHPMLELSEDKYQQFSTLVENFELEDLVQLIQINLELMETLRKESSERFWIENTAFKMLDYKNRVSLSELRQEIFRVVGRQGAVGQVQAGSNRVETRPQAMPQPTNTQNSNSGFGAQLAQFQQEKKQAPQPAPRRVEAPVEISKPVPREALQEIPQNNNISVEPAIIQEPVPLMPSKSMPVDGDDIESSIKNLFN